MRKRKRRTSALLAPPAGRPAHANKAELLETNQPATLSPRRPHESDAAGYDAQLPASLQAAVDPHATTTGTATTASHSGSARAMRSRLLSSDELEAQKPPHLPHQGAAARGRATPDPDPTASARAAPDSDRFHTARSSPGGGAQTAAASRRRSRASDSTSRSGARSGGASGRASGGGGDGSMDSEPTRGRGVAQAEGVLQSELHEAHVKVFSVLGRGGFGTVYHGAPFFQHSLRMQQYAY